MANLRPSQAPSEGPDTASSSMHNGGQQLPSYFPRTTRLNRLIRASTSTDRTSSLLVDGHIMNHRVAIGTIDRQTTGSEFTNLDTSAPSVTIGALRRTRLCGRTGPSQRGGGQLSPPQLVKILVNRSSTLVDHWVLVGGSGWLFVWSSKSRRAASQRPSARSVNSAHRPLGAPGSSVWVIGNPVRGVQRPPEPSERGLSAGAQDVADLGPGQPVRGLKRG